MSPRERIANTVARKPLDRVARGEILVEEAFLRQYYAVGPGIPVEVLARRLSQEAAFDLMTVPFAQARAAPCLEAIRRWAEQTDLFVVALIDGVFWHPDDPLDFEAYLLAMAQGEPSLRELLASKEARALKAVDGCLGAGAHGCMVGDDIAYQAGSLVSPSDLEEWIFPSLRRLARRIRDAGGVAFFHSCGHVMKILDRIADLGFDAFHGLSPAAGNDVLVARSVVGDRLVLMGGVDVDGVSPERIGEERGRVLPALGRHGGYILSSSSGLSQGTDPAAFRVLYGMMR